MNNSFDATVTFCRALLRLNRPYPPSRNNYPACIPGSVLVRISPAMTGWNRLALT